MPGGGSCQSKMASIVPKFMLALPTAPKDILLLKSHSMGVGDLLRSSAAWAAIKARWPQVNIHLCMLSNHEGYVVQELIGSHHLLSSVHFITAKLGRPGEERQKSLSIAETFSRIQASLGALPLDLVIDCEPAGIRTSLLARRIARARSAISVGIAQFPLRRFFYNMSAPSSRAYRSSRKLPRLMDYTDRDFVVLAALGIERRGARINLRLSAKGVAWKQAFGPTASPGRKLVVLNIGCGTSDALVKRPAIASFVENFLSLYGAAPFELHLAGAGFEKDANTQFARLFETRMAKAGFDCLVKDWAGALSIEESAALLDCADLVVSTDSGPYHMAVALGVPTLCWFKFDTLPSVHAQAGVICLTEPLPAAFTSAALELLNFDSGG